MAGEKTQVLLEIEWDPKETDHPAGWDYKTLLGGDPFGSEGSHKVRLISFEDVDSDNRPVQV